MLCSDQGGKQPSSPHSNVEQFGLVHEGSGLLIADYRASPCFGRSSQHHCPNWRVLTIHELTTGLPSEVIIATALIMEYFEEKRTGLQSQSSSAIIL